MSKVIGRKMKTRMRSMVIGIATLSGIVLGGTLPSQAWFGDGHEVIALLAYRELKPQTRAAVDALLKSHPDYANWQKELPTGLTADQQREDLFAIAATWPDRIKSFSDKSVSIHFFDPTDRRHPAPKPLPTDPHYPDLLMHKDWHYADIPIDADGVVRPSPVGETAVTQIPVCRDGVANKTLSDSNRAYYLCWLEHLVGDIHQPLHATSRYSAAYPDGDRGGNSVRLDSDGGEGPNELHAYWDGLLGDFGGGRSDPSVAAAAWKSLDATAATITKEAPQILSGFSPQVENDLRPEDWAHESYIIDEDFVYTIGPDGPGPIPQPGTAYHTIAVEIAHERGALAGHRLALMIEGALAKNPAP